MLNLTDYRYFKKHVIKFWCIYRLVFIMIKYKKMFNSLDLHFVKKTMRFILVDHLHNIITCVE